MSSSCLRRLLGLPLMFWSWQSSQAQSMQDSLSAPLQHFRLHQQLALKNTFGLHIPMDPHHMWLQVACSHLKMLNGASQPAWPCPGSCSLCCQSLASQNQWCPAGFASSIAARISIKLDCSDLAYSIVLFFPVYWQPAAPIHLRRTEGRFRACSTLANAILNQKMHLHVCSL